VRLAHRHQEVAGPGVHLPQVDVVRRQELEFVERRISRLGPLRHDALGTRQHQGEGGEEQRARDRRRVEREQHRETGHGRQHGQEDQPERPFARAEPQVERHAVGARLRARNLKRTSAAAFRHALQIRPTA
jgi:hypothetical protein